MVRVESRSLHGRGISVQAMNVVHAAVSYAERRKETPLHSILLADFCNLSGLDAGSSPQQVMKLMAQAQRAVVSVKIVDATGSGRQQKLASGSWPVFLSLMVTNTHVSFEICRYMWDEIEVGLASN